MSAVDRLYFEVIRHRQQLGSEPETLAVTPFERLELATNMKCPLVSYDPASDELKFMDIPLALTE
jgi:hypothetical protein